MATKTEVKSEAPKRVMVRLPRLPAGENQDVFVAVNGKAIMIRRGTEVEIEEQFANALRDSELAEVVAEKFIEDNAFNG